MLNIESSMATDTFFPMEGFEPSSHEELHVLAVDDSLVDRKVIERLLKISACKVTAVDSARRALQYLGLDGDATSVDGFNALKVNLIITDYWMPGMTGYELLKKIKESSAFKEIPVVIMSSENVLPRINKCLEEGAEEFIVKPVKLSDVRRLKDNITREEVEEEHKIKGTNKRKLDVSFSSPLDSSSSSSSSSSQLTSLSSASSLDLDASSPLDVSALSSSSSSSSSSSTSSPVSSPSRRLKISDENNNYSD